MKTAPHTSEIIMALSKAEEDSIDKKMICFEPYSFWGWIAVSSYFEGLVVLVLLFRFWVETTSYLWRSVCLNFELLGSLSQIIRRNDLIQPKLIKLLLNSSKLR